MTKLSVESETNSVSTGSLCVEGQLFVRCAASTVKLLVHDVLETSGEIINKVRETIGYVKGSQGTQEKFNEIVQLVGINWQKGLFIDNPFRWNSTYMMLEAALEYKEALPSTART
ncbi:UNVERIFIED_CONTAM: Zinc finger BED domain-containing protein RICESLEEPER 1 [Sesamum radiatum]|uniref:Zinc finger BED domain-containing protein RICESLEEPER 1 n=1 Tax=Sesamum radiatum TaxID=300843 RepID=A0AAW2KL95_SESRA